MRKPGCGMFMWFVWSHHAWSWSPFSSSSFNYDFIGFHGSKENVTRTYEANFPVVTSPEKDTLESARVLRSWFSGQQIPHLFLTVCVTLGNWLHFSEPWFSYVQNENKNTSLREEHSVMVKIMDYLVVKRNGILTEGTTWVNLENMC